MKLFVVNTFSTSGDHYTYVIKHPQCPTEDELKAFLVKHSSDKDDFVLYEAVQDVVPVLEDHAITIPKVPRTTLNKWYVAE